MTLSIVVYICFKVILSKIVETNAFIYFLAYCKLHQWHGREKLCVSLFKIWVCLFQRSFLNNCYAYYIKLDLCVFLLLYVWIVPCWWCLYFIPLKPVALTPYLRAACWEWKCILNDSWPCFINNAIIKPITVAGVIKTIFFMCSHQEHTTNFVPMMNSIVIKPGAQFVQFW